MIITIFGTALGLAGTLTLQQCHLNDATDRRLHLAVFESRGNREVVTHIFQDFRDFSKDSLFYSIRIQQPDISMATAALSDPNTTARLSPYKFSLLVLYTDTHLQLNNALNLYNEYTLAGTLQTSKNQEVFSNNEQAFSEIIARKAALAAITCDYLQDLLPAYSHQYPCDPNDPYDEQRIQATTQDIEDKLTKIMSGTISIDSPLGATSVLTSTLTTHPSPSAIEPTQPTY